MFGQWEKTGAPGENAAPTSEPPHDCIHDLIQGP